MKTKLENGKNRLSGKVKKISEKLVDKYFPVNLIGRYDPATLHKERVERLNDIVNELEEKIDTYENTNPFMKDRKQEQEIILLSYAHKGLVGRLYSRGGTTYDVSTYSCLGVKNEK